VNKEAKERTGAPQDPGPGVSLLTLPTEPLDPVPKQLPFLVVEEFVAVAGFSFAQDRSLDLVAVVLARYPCLGHEATRSWSGPRGATNTAGATSLSGPLTLAF
jgi:hypothetical protein